MSSNLKHDLPSKFQISNLGTLNYFLKLEIREPLGGLFVNQAKYLINLLSTSGMPSAKPCLTPMSTIVDLHAFVLPFSNITLYQQLVGLLQYLTFTCLDIAFVVNRVNQFMQQPTVIHYTNVKRIL